MEIIQKGLRPSRVLPRPAHRLADATRLLRCSAVLACALLLPIPGRTAQMHVLHFDASSGGTYPGPPFLLDMDFGAGLAQSSKSGFAAIGQSPNDFWNWYSRDDGQGGWRTFGAATNLALADGTVTPIGMTVANAPGAWGNGSTDPMYATYIYPFDGGNVTITVTNLPAGAYDVLPYANDGNFEVSVGITSYGDRQSLDPTISNPPVWTEGVQYARFTNVLVNAGDSLLLTVRPGVYGYAIISGLQIVQSSARSGFSPPVIVTEPASQTVPRGGTANFSVAASGAGPLGYQWSFNGSTLDGANGSSLTLTNVGKAQAGTYAVLVSNPYGSMLSSNALLTVSPPSTNKFLLDMDFGAGLAQSAKTGFAAIGQTANDFWNWYSRDDGQGGWRTFGAATNLELANGTATQIGMTVANAPGAWGNGSTDPMYATYIYPFDGGDVTIQVTNLPAGEYNVLPYANDGNFEVSVDGLSYGVRQCLDAPVLNPPVWTEGKQYVRFTNVVVDAGQTLVLTVRPGVYGYAIISGMQLVQAGGKGIPAHINTQPVNRTVPPGGTARFRVGAGGTPPLSYQWTFNGTNLDSARGSSLTLTNVQAAQAGSYAVLVSNPFGSMLSSNALLSLRPTSRNKFLLDMDFGAGLAQSAKTGFAAIGQRANDFWNWYSRDDGQGGWRTFGAATNLELANGKVTQIGMTVANAPGAWGNGSTDPMYATYIYPFDGGNVTITVTNLPAGIYDVLPYANDGNFEVSVGGTSYGVRQSLDTTIANPPVWTEGVQYVRFSDVAVNAGQALVLTVRPGVYGYAIISGIQFTQVLVDHPPVAANLSEATRQNQPLAITAAKLLLSASDPDGDPLMLSVSATSTDGGTVALSGGVVTYTPVSGFVGVDRFTYTVNDGRGGSASAYVLVQVRPGNGTSGNLLPLVPIAGGHRVSFAGLPGYTYTLQRAPSPAGPWTTVGSVTTGANGIGVYLDTNAPPLGAFYRTRYP